MMKVNLNLKEKENLMSLGIKKRIALAQVFYKKSELIIFDDPQKVVINQHVNFKFFLIIKFLKNNYYFFECPIIQGADIVLELKKGNSQIYFKK